MNFLLFSPLFEKEMVEKEEEVEEGERREDGRGGSGEREGADEENELKMRKMMEEGKGKMAVSGMMEERGGGRND